METREFWKRELHVKELGLKICLDRSFWSRLKGLTFLIVCEGLTWSIKTVLGPKLRAPDEEMDWFAVL